MLGLVLLQSITEVWYCWKEVLFRQLKTVNKSYENS
jgi:hypothetical protein